MKIEQFETQFTVKCSCWVFIEKKSYGTETDTNGMFNFTPPILDDIEMLPKLNLRDSSSSKYLLLEFWRLMQIESFCRLHLCVCEWNPHQQQRPDELFTHHPPKSAHPPSAMLSCTPLFVYGESVCLAWLVGWCYSYVKYNYSKSTSSTGRGLSY